VGVEGEAHDLHLVAFERVVALASLGIPNLGLLVEGAGHNFISVRIIEGHAVDHVGMLVQTQQLLAGVGVPDLASTVVAACNELVSIFVKRTVRERQQVRSQNLKKREFLLLVLHLLLNQLFDELLELRFAGGRNQGLLKQNVVNQTVNVSLGCEVEQVDGLGLSLTTLTKVLKNDSRWVESKQKSLERNHGVPIARVLQQVRHVLFVPTL